MRKRHLRLPPYLLAYVLPVVVVAALLGLLNFLSFAELQKQLQDVNQQQGASLSSINAINKFNRDLAQTQGRVATYLREASEGRLDEANAYRNHAEIVELMGQLDAQLKRLQVDPVALAGDANHQTLDEITADFAVHRSLIIMASDLAAIDPPGAMRQAYLAATSYGDVSEHLQELAQKIATEVSRENERHTATFKAQGARTVVQGGLLLAALIGIWLLIGQRVTRRLNVIARKLQELAGGVVNPDSPDSLELEAIAGDPNSSLRSLALSVKAFRETLVAYQGAQADLRERIKEMSCLYDVTRLTEDDEIGPDSLFTAIAERLPAAMRFPELAIGFVEHGDQLFCRDPACFRQSDERPEREVLSAEFCGFDGATGRIGIIHRQSAPADEAFLAEEHELFEALAKQLSSAIKRRTAGAARRDSEEMLREVIENVPTAVELVDIETLRYVRINAATCDFLGYSADEMLGMHVQDIQAALSGEQLEALTRGILRSGGAQFENRLRRKDGSAIDVVANVRPIRRKGKDYLLGIWRDVTAEKAAAADLRKLSMAVEQSPESIVITNLNAEIEYVNEAFVRNTGYTREEALGANPNLLQSGSTSAATYSEMWAALTAGQPWRGELVNRRKDGSEYTEDAHIVPIKDADGRISRYLAIKQDITEMKRINEELESYREHLEEQVERRTSEFLAAKIEAENANRAKSEFLANMSHEIRTPMNAIIGMTHLLRSSLEDPRKRERVDKISTAANHLLNIINDILDLSKIEAGKMTLESTDFDIERVIENVCGLLQDKAEAKGLELVIELRGVPPMLHGDRLRLGQILLNFLGNAIKFTDSGTITVRGWIAGASDSGITLHLAVADTGIGLSTEQKERLFNAFEQADASTTRRYGGTGLGLTINRRLVDLMGGRIGVDSEPGRGSTFWVEVPLGFSEAEPVTPAVTLPTRGLHTLLIDDQPEARESLMEMLESQGMRVTALPDGSSALAILKAAEADGEPFDIVLCDWQMPGLDGITLGRQMSTAALARQPLRLLITAHGHDLAPNALVGTGYHQVVAKPLTPSRLHDAIQHLLSTDYYASKPRWLGGASAEDRLRASGMRRILLADDNAINREVAGELLINVGMQVDFAEDGRQAVNLARQRAYDLILMDMQMPVLDGLQATQEIRGLPGLATTPIIAMTANAFAEDRQACLDAGMNDHLAKPITPEVLYESLLHWLPASVPTPAAALQAATSPAISDAEVRQHLAAIPGLDLAVGLHAANNRLSLYVRLMTMFVEQKKADELLVALENGDYQAARLHAHTIKGTTATIGAEALRQAAASLENSLRSLAGAPDETMRGELLARARALTTDCATLQAAIGAALAAPASIEPPLEPLDQQRLGEVVARLDTLLDADEMAASDVFHENEALLHQAFGKTAARIGQLIDDFSYADALKKLRTASAAPANPTQSAPR